MESSAILSTGVAIRVVGLLLRANVIENYSTFLRFCPTGNDRSIPAGALDMSANGLQSRPLTAGGRAQGQYVVGAHAYRSDFVAEVPLWPCESPPHERSAGCASCRL